MRKKPLFKNFRRCLLLILFVAIFISFIGINSYAGSAIEEYAPILYFESEENCYPIDVQYQIQNSYLYDVGNPFVILTSPTKLKISAYSSETYKDYYLDNQLGNLDDFEQIIRSAESWESSNGNVVYYHNSVDNSTGEEIIQYWMFYAFNDGELNKHEGDWEMVQVFFEGGQPSMVGYSQHHSGQKATWNQVEKEGNHIKVYVARGSHANYLRSYSGKFGIASDIVGANGKILNPDDYQLIDLDSELFTNYIGKWGVVSTNEDNAIESSILGQAGPEGPKYREDGAMWEGFSWQSSLKSANDTIFIVEWFFYNFLLIFALISAGIIGLMAYKIYRRHKKFGLGPRIVSMFYINGFNLHSIGNILCFVGIIIAVIGLFLPWYTVSYSATGTGVSETFQSSTMIDLLNFDGINGLQVNIPGNNGPVPMGSFVLPFSALILIGLIFMIISTIGIPLSKKLGGKYIWRGIRIIIPFILIVAFIIILGYIIPPLAGGEASSYIEEVVRPFTSQPLGGQSSTTIVESGLSAYVNLKWGVGIGAWMLLFSGIILIVAGFLEISSKTQFFATKTPLAGQVPPPIPIQHAQPHPPQQKIQESLKKKQTKVESKDIFCTECGSKIEKDSKFCDKCGKSVDK